MDIGALSMVMGQSRVQESASIGNEDAMSTGKETATPINRNVENCCVNPNLANHLDTRVWSDGWKWRTTSRALVGAV